VLIPSPVWIADGTKKQVMFERYLTKLAAIPCKYFNFGEGECPFFNHCYYRHSDRDGNDVEKPKGRFQTGEDGEAQLARDPTLFDFIH